MKKIYETELRIVRRNFPFEVPDEIVHPKAASKIFEVVFDMSHQAQEIFAVLFLDEQNHVLGIEKISMGDVDCVDVSLHELFKRCFVHNARKMIVCHNHISDDAVPSYDDVHQMWVFSQAGLPFGIQIEDSIIISDETFFTIRGAFQFEKYSPEDDFIGDKLKKIYEKIRKERTLIPLPIND